jgi:hypothetical protein
MQEDGVRSTIRYGYLRAKKHGFTTKRNVCLYINNMLELGSNFDEDPQYPWAQLILQQPGEQNANLRIDKLSDKALSIISEITGPDHLHLNRALLRLHYHADEIFESLTRSDLSSAPQHLQQLFARKYDIIGEVNMRNLIRKGVMEAPAYGLTSESNRLLYIVFMFMMGSGFNKDPQFNWAEGILNDRNVKNQNEKAELLYQKVISHLRSFVSKIES